MSISEAEASAKLEVLGVELNSAKASKAELMDQIVILRSNLGFAMRQLRHQKILIKTLREVDVTLRRLAPAATHDAFMLPTLARDNLLKQIEHAETQKPARRT